MENVLKELNIKLKEINTRMMDLTNFKVLHQDGKVYVVDSNEMFNSWDEMGQELVWEISEFLEPLGYYLETESTNRHYLVQD